VAEPGLSARALRARLPAHLPALSLRFTPCQIVGASLAHRVTLRGRCAGAAPVGSRRSAPAVVAAGTCCARNAVAFAHPPPESTKRPQLLQNRGAHPSAADGTGGCHRQKPSAAPQPPAPFPGQVYPAASRRAHDGSPGLPRPREDRERFPSWRAAQTARIDRPKGPRWAPSPNRPLSLYP
jgi:hypothetical protein